MPAHATLLNTILVMDHLQRSPGKSFIWVVLIVGVLALAHRVYFGLWGPLSGVAAIHWVAPFSGCYNLYLKLFCNVQIAHYEAHVSKYDGSTSPLVRVGPSEVSIIATADVKASFGANFERSVWYSVFANFGEYNMFSFTSSKDHASRKRIFASAYSRTTISGSKVQNLILSRVAKLIRFLDDQASPSAASQEESTAIVIRHIFRALQADIFTALAFSDAEGSRFLDKLKVGANGMDDLGMRDLDLLHDDKRDEFFFYESEIPFKYISRFLAWHGPKVHQRAQAWVSNYITRHENRSKAQDSIESSNDDKPSGDSVYDKLLFYRNPATGERLRWAERASEVMDHAVAGQDAVPAALEFIIRMISLHPQVQTQLRLELLASSPVDLGTDASRNIDSLIYLNAVVIEGLRTVDTISSYQTRIVPKGGCVLSGYFLPAGTTIVAQPYVVNRQSGVFPKPDAFDPARWLIPWDEYRALARNMWTYSSGPRSCLGRELSLAIIKRVLVEIYTRYSTELSQPYGVEEKPRKGDNGMMKVIFRKGQEQKEW